MIDVRSKYGFPLFTRAANNVYLGNHKKLIVADLWSFWDYVIKKKGFEREFMNSLLEQAKNFYIAAESSPVKSKPLLYYYSFLNLSKLIINLEKEYGMGNYLHGMDAKHNSRFSHSIVKIVPLKPDVKNVTAELLSVLDGKQMQSMDVKNLKKYLRHCVGIHRAYSEIYNLEEVFFKLRNKKVYRKGKKLGVRFEVYCDEENLSLLALRGYRIIEEEGKFIWQEEVDMNGYVPSRGAYFELSSKLRQLGIWYFLGPDGYSLYISSQKSYRESPEMIIYNVMFFLGSITRYHPYMFDKIFSDKEQWLMSEFLTTQPKQFLYLASAKVLGQEILKSYSNI